jgi:hypothetical protein
MWSLEFLACTSNSQAYAPLRLPDGKPMNSRMSSLIHVPISHSWTATVDERHFQYLWSPTSNHRKLHRYGLDRTTRPDNGNNRPWLLEDAYRELLLAALRP